MKMKLFLNDEDEAEDLETFKHILEETDDSIKLPKAIVTDCQKLFEIGNIVEIKRVETQAKL